MFKNMMLNARLNEYIDTYELEKKEVEMNERKYICHTYLSQVQPDRLDRNMDLLEKICEGIYPDEKLIGVAITLNQQLLEIETDIDDILPIEGKGKFDIYIFAYKDCPSVNKLLEDIEENKDEENDFSRIIQRIYSQKVITKWEDLPNVNIVYIDEKEEECRTEKCDKFYENIYHINEDKLLRIAQANDNDYKAVLPYEEGFPCPKKDNEGQTYVVLCTADKLAEILRNEDGLIRTNMFDANVRAYQGDTDVNNEMVMTLSECPSNFVLYNNGITIVCSKFEIHGKTLEIRNPQVVNGCQTCNSIFKVYTEGKDVSEAKVIVKVIETTGVSVTQGIVRGTNRQNIVYEEAFETIRRFHVDLEEFISIMNTKGFHKVYYERRSKQYSSDSKIKPYQKINFRNLIQSTIALYMDKVEVSHRHESKLVKDYKDILFVDGQSFYPYYVAALLSSSIDCVFRTEKKLKDLRNYKMHILFLIQELNMGASPNINNREEIEPYCKKFLILLSNTEFKELVFAAANKFRELTEKWVKKKGSNYRFFIKDNPEFTEFMLSELRGNTKVNAHDNIYHGVVMNVSTDKYGNLFGFISHKPENVYFNEIDNPELNISYEGKKVSYRLTGTAGRKQRAINVKLM